MPVGVYLALVDNVHLVAVRFLFDDLHARIVSSLRHHVYDQILLLFVLRFHEEIFEQRLFDHLSLFFALSDNVQTHVHVARFARLRCDRIAQFAVRLLVQSINLLNKTIITLLVVYRRSDMSMHAHFVLLQRFLKLQIVFTYMYSDPRFQFLSESGNL